MLEIRPLTEASIPAVRAIEVLCFPDPWSEKGLRDTLREDCACFLGAWSGETLCGYVNATWVLDEVNINRICTHPAFRRQGAAKGLFAALDDFCRKRGITRFFLEVRESNAAAQALYRSLGFTETGRRPNFYENPAEGAVLMARILPEQE